jgi:hypothetical protein
MRKHHPATLRIELVEYIAAGPHPGGRTTRRFDVRAMTVRCNIDIFAYNSRIKPH